MSESVGPPNIPSSSPAVLKHTFKKTWSPMGCGTVTLLPRRSQLTPSNVSLAVDLAIMVTTQSTRTPEVVQPSATGGVGDTTTVWVSTSVAPSLSVTVSVTVKSVGAITL